MNEVINYHQSPRDEDNYSDRIKRFSIVTLEQPETPETSFEIPFGKINHFEIIWIKKGSTALEINSTNIDFTESNIYVITPGNTRKSIPKIGIEGYYISFTSEFIRLQEEGCQLGYSWFDKYLDIATIIINQEMQHELEVIARQMKTEYNNFFNKRQELLRGLLHIFMIYLSRYLNENPPVILRTREEELTIGFMNLVKKEFKLKKMVSHYACHLCVTPNYLNRAVKKTTGFPASYHIHKEIINEAKRNAIHPGVNMKEVAYNLGFETPAHFSKFFKNYSGMNFTDYKKTEVLLNV